MHDPPTKIRANRPAGVLELAWPDGRDIRLPFRLIREECPCASCIDEVTGQRILDTDRIPADIHPQSMAFVGNYAIKIVWSDGHSNGLYSWDTLNRLSREV